MHPSRLGSLAPSNSRICQALCSRITLNGATQPKPNLWSLTSTSLLWLGWPTLTPVLTPPKPLRESVTPSCDPWPSLACGPVPLAARDNLPSTWAKTPRRTTAALSHVYRGALEDKYPLAHDSTELAAATAGGSPEQSGRRSYTAQEADECLLRRLPLSLDILRTDA